MMVENVVYIDAPQETVWHVTADVERWPEWTPTVSAVKRTGSEPFGVGSVARIRQPAQPESEWIVTAFDPPRSFAWETRRPGLHMVAMHEISTEGGRTRNLLRVRAGGMLAVLLWPLLRLAMRRALSDENAGLKQRCEQALASGSS